MKLQVSGKSCPISNGGIAKEVSWETQGSANEVWDKMAKGIRNIEKETVGESRGFRIKGKESWWWDTSVQNKVKVKTGCSKEWFLCRNAKDWK